MLYYPESIKITDFSEPLSKTGQRVFPLNPYLQRPGIIGPIFVLTEKMSLRSEFHRNCRKHRVSTTSVSIYRIFRFFSPDKIAKISFPGNFSCYDKKRKSDIIVIYCPTSALLTPAAL